MNPTLVLALALYFLNQEQKVIPEEKPRAEPAEARNWFEFFKETAADYEISPPGDPNAKLTLRLEPILRWGNQVRENSDGAVFLWLDKGRPGAIGAIFTYRETVLHEFHSLALTPLTAVWRHGEVWSLARPGLKLNAIANAPTPGETPSARLTQMRNLAREFSASTEAPEDRGGNRWELRLMPRPLYRYESDASDPLDGALFVLAQGTDPEVILLIEARQKQSGYEWQYGVARFSDLKIVVRHQGKEVWEAPALTLGPTVRRDPNEPYVLYPGQ